MRTLRVCRFLALIFCASASVVLAPLASAAIVVSNLAETTNSNLVFGDLDEGGGSRFGVDAAQSFTTGVFTATLNSITVKMDTDVGGGSFSLQLWSNVSGSPGTSLLTLSGNSDPATAGPFTYTGSFALNANTTYWVVETVPHSAPDKEYTWRETTSTNETSAFGWTMGNLAKYRNVHTGVPDASWSNDIAAPQMSIDATIVPEPSALVLLGIAGGSLLASRRRKLG